MQKLISIIISTYNSADTLDSCLQSILIQKDESIELLILDGLSSDKTIEVAKKYENYIDLINSEPDNGIYDAWNKGIRLSNAPWIMFVGSDDEIRPGSLERYKTAINSNSDVDYISGKNMIVNKHGKNLREFGEAFSWKNFRSVMNMAHVSSLHNRRLYTKYGLYDDSYKICGDYELLLRAGKDLKTTFIDEILSNMTTGGVSYGSFEALKESKIAKIRHKTKPHIHLYLEYIFSVFKLALKRFLYKVRVIKDL